MLNYIYLMGFYDEDYYRKRDIEVDFLIQNLSAFK